VAPRPAPPRFAGGWIAVVAGCVVTLLVGTAGRYGYHRDELYYLAAGRHLAWGYPDQPPLVALLARLIWQVAPGSLVVLRVPSAFAAAAVVALTGLLTREPGGQRAAQLVAAASMAAAGLLLGAGHLLSTTTYDLVFWALLLWLVVRILRTGDQRLWLVTGIVAGIGLLNKDLIAFLMPFQLGLVSPYLAPIWIVGLARLFRDPTVRWCAAIGWAYALLAVVFLAVGGKPY
jgi:4-amino-4-deoxy-L-arabinose transferase-like glycosyltransferase